MIIPTDLLSYLTFKVITPDDNLYFYLVYIILFAILFVFTYSKKPKNNVLSTQFVSRPLMYCILS
jgi:hypothetical protein